MRLSDQNNTYRTRSFTCTIYIHRGSINVRASITRNTLAPVIAFIYIYIYIYNKGPELFLVSSHNHADKTAGSELAMRSTCRMFRNAGLKTQLIVVVVVDRVVSVSTHGKSMIF